MSNYYFLVAGLADISFDDERINTSFEVFKEEIYPLLTVDDKKLIDMIFYQYDQRRLLSLLRRGDDNRQNINDVIPISDRGMFSDEELLELIAAAKRGDPDLSEYPTYFFQFVSEYINSETGFSTSFPEDRLNYLFYDYVSKANNMFVRNWFCFNKDLNNMLVAFTARRNSLSTVGYVIGDDEIAESLRNSGSRDWGLSGTVDFYDELMQIEEEDNLTSRERKIDQLKWRWLDDNSFFNYFSIERIFTFLIKLEIVERWINLDKEKGQQLFRALIEGLKKGVKVPSEFDNN